ncbi:Phytoene dehydrogenase-related protein [Deinococcus reticulitermitis]|uniref:Phytoene dehydrogenase-related protein n=1 Tax=Deinococcus reticulitermitis TaxID=856736 RepID=A0A1H6XB06_9DEIO|nr:NAD(P)/FAD-dependent oxidoreductase [Deinococcus reticulitermitis]SEJ23767.1 Phytoene dehydrogenase-related protein [Deinococcus reticulitermitis]
MGEGRQSVGILGGGLAGLALACLLAERGHPVTVYERDRAGGKLRRLEVGGLAFDTGPSLFTFPEVWRAFLARLGEADPLDLQPLPGGLGLHHTPFGTVPLPVPPEHPLFAEWERYLTRLEPLRPHLGPLLSTPPQLWRPDFLRASRALFGVTGPHLTAEGWIRAQRYPPALAHALRTHALNAGRAPQDAPALYALIPGLVGHEVFRPARGMGALLETLLSFARARGVEVLEGVEVTRLRGTTLTFRDGGAVTHDLLVSALDPQRLRRLRGQGAPSPAARRTVSGLAIYAALPGPAPLPATSVLPPSDFRAFRRALRAGAWPPDTLALVHADGPRLAVLLTVPALTRRLGPDHPWVQAELRRVEETLGVPGLLRSALDVQVLDPLHYAAGGHPGGAIYGAAHPLWRSGPFHPEPYRPAPGLWQVGTGVHPGGGIPAVLGGALTVDRLIGAAIPDAHHGG